MWACGGGGSDTSGGFSSGTPSSDNSRMPPNPSQPVQPGAPVSPTTPGDAGSPPPTNDPDSPINPPVEEEPQDQEGIYLFAGTATESGFLDGTGTQARFQDITQIESDAAGNLYVVDSGTIRKVSPAGSVSTLAGAPDAYGHQDGTGNSARFGQNPDPNSYGYGRPATDGIEIAVEPDGNIYVLDRPYVRQVSVTGEVTTILDATERGIADGPLDMARFLRMRSIEVDGEGNIYIEDETGAWGSIAIRRISPDGVVSTIHTDCLSQYAGCFDLKVDLPGNLYFMSQRIPASAGSARSLASPSLVIVGQDERLANGPVLPWDYDRLTKVSVLDIDNSGNLYFYHLQHEGIMHASYPDPWQITRSESFLKKLTPAGETIIIEPFTKEHGARWDTPIIDADGRTLPALQNHRPITVTRNGNIYHAGQTYITRVVTPH